MPYYLYIVTPGATGTVKHLEYLEQFDKLFHNVYDLG